MKVKEMTEAYIVYRRSLGEKYNTGATMLRSFARHVGEDKVAKGIGPYIYSKAELKLGHVSVETTNIYAEVNLEMKAKALLNCEMKAKKSKKHWRDDKNLMAFLDSL